MAKHQGVSLADANRFEWDFARIFEGIFEEIGEDSRKQYPAQRFEATGCIGQRLKGLIFVAAKTP